MASTKVDDIKETLLKLQAPSEGLVNSLEDLGTRDEAKRHSRKRSADTADPGLSEEDIMSSKKKAAIDKIELLSRTDKAAEGKGAENPAFGSDLESAKNSSSSGYTSNGEVKPM